MADVVCLRLHGKRLCSEVPLAYCNGPLYASVHSVERDVWRPSRKSFARAQQSARSLPPAAARIVSVVATFVLGMRSHVDVIELVHTQDVWRNVDDKTPILEAAMRAAYSSECALAEVDNWLAELCALVKER